MNEEKPLSSPTASPPGGEPLLATTPDAEAQFPDDVTLLKAQNYTLPPAIKSMMSTAISQSNNLAITTALFAGVMIGLAQIIDSSSYTNSGSKWGAARLFIYGSIITNLTTTMLALLMILFCSELEESALRKVLSDADSLPHRVVRYEERIPAPLLLNKSKLFEAFGMRPHYKWVELGELIWVITGMCFTFLALASWVWLSQTHAVFGVLMIFIVSGFLGLTVCLIGPVITG